jgi:hypothetical protein
MKFTMAITCKRCEQPKHPGLFRPAEVRRFLAGKIKSLLCCECHGRTPQGLRAAQGAVGVPWRDSNASFFGKSMAEGRSH